MYNGYKLYYQLLPVLFIKRPGLVPNQKNRFEKLLLKVCLSNTMLISKRNDQRYSHSGTRLNSNSKFEFHIWNTSERTTGRPCNSWLALSKDQLS